MGGRRYILVEGSDDLHVVSHFLLARGLDLQQRQIEIEFPKPDGGINPLLDGLEIRLAVMTDPDDRLLIIVDANGNPESRMHAVVNHLSNAGFAALEMNSTEFESPYGSKVAVWLMPDNNRPGTLEDFWLGFLEQDDARLVAAEVAIEEYSKHVAITNPNLRSKMLAHIVLALSDDPGCRLGAAINRQYLDATGENGNVLFNLADSFFG